MKKFMQNAISLISGYGHPVCEYIAGNLIDIDISSELQTSLRKDSNPIACKYLEQAYSNKNSIDICTDLATISDQLVWTEAPRGAISTYMDDKHTMTHIVGPDYGYMSQNVRFGTFLLAPETVYPLHSHAAEEIYIPISGSGKWWLKGGVYEWKKPGSLIHYKSWIPHAIRSDKEPLLMLWAWFGDMSFDAYRIEQEAYNENGIPI